MCKICVPVIVVSLSVACLKAQQIIGTITTTGGEKIEIANVLFREASALLQVKEFLVAYNGSFTYTLKHSYTSLLIEVTSLNYFSSVILISYPSTDSVYRLKFELQEKPPKVLDEIVIKALPQHITEKEDTVVYRVSDFTDGTEDKVQDILKKLPGIEVNEVTGELKFKGKSVERVLLDGDDLFGLNYTVGTKNMSANMVEEVEAIDNFTENPLLKNLVNSEKVALNLKLKKGKTDLSGNVKLEGGSLGEKAIAHDLNANVLAISQNYKSFAVAHFNNVGKNNSPFDYFDYTITEEEQNDENARVREIIPHAHSMNQLDESRANINGQQYGNYNVAGNINQKIRTRMNLFLFKDRITSVQNFANRYAIGSDEFVTTDDTEILRLPLQLRGDMEVKYSAAKNLLIESLFKSFLTDVSTTSNTIQNKQLDFSSDLASKEFFFKHSLVVTRKIRDNSALQFLSNYTHNTLNQQLAIAPSPFTSSDQSSQTTATTKGTWDVKGSYYHSRKQKKIDLSIGYRQVRTPLTSSFDEVFINNLVYTSANLYHTLNLDLKHRLFTWKFSLNTRYNKQRINFHDSVNDTTAGKLVFEPHVKVQFKPDGNTRVTCFLGASYSENQENFMFSNRIMLNNRTTVTNSPSLRLQRSDKLNLNYVKDIFSSFTQIRMGFNVERQSGIFLSNSTISENITLINFFNSPESVLSSSINASFSKYIHGIESTIRLVSNYTLTRYLNIINNSVLRRNYSGILDMQIFWKTAFDGSINLENTANYFYMASSSANQQFRFTNSSLLNSMKVLYKPTKNLTSVFSWEVYCPTLGNAYYLSFIDLIARYTSQDAKWSAFVHLRNLGNTNFIEEVTTSDVSDNFFRTNILPRQITAGLTFTF